MGILTDPLTRSYDLLFAKTRPANRFAVEGAIQIVAHLALLETRKEWRRGSESNRRIKVLQTSPLPLGYRAAYFKDDDFLQTTNPRRLRGQKYEIWSGRRDLNPRLRPWQGRTLPLSYSRSAIFDYIEAAK